jgi:hypothetical protein
MLEKVKVALKITTNDFDSELSDMINAAILDLGLAGIINTLQTDALVIRAICTYCRLNWGSPADYDKLKASYDEQKAQMSMSSLYNTETT